VTPKHPTLHLWVDVSYALVKEPLDHGVETNFGFLRGKRERVKCVFERVKQDGQLL
jgi:hypothetical protein